MAAPYTLKQLRARRREIEDIVARSGATNVRVFGSVATGDAGPTSDVDILVDLNPGTSPAEIFAISARLQDALGVRVDVLSLRPDHMSYDTVEAVALAKRIAAEAVPL